MSSVAADQILKIVAPAPSKGDALRADAPRDGTFDRHLEQAAAARPERAKSVASSREEKPEVEQTTTAKQSQDDSAHTAEEGGVEAAQSSEDPVDEGASIEQDEADELELSSAAAAAVEAGAVLDGVIVVDSEAAQIVSVAEIGGGRDEQLSQQAGETFVPVDAAPQVETAEAAQIEAGTGVVDTTEQSEKATVRLLEESEAPTEEVVSLEAVRLEAKSDPTTSIAESNAEPTEEPNLELENAVPVPTPTVAEETASTGQPPAAALPSEPPPSEAESKPAASRNAPDAPEIISGEEKPEVELRHARNEPAVPQGQANHGAVENSAAALRPGETPAPSSIAAQSGPTETSPSPTVDRNRFVQRVSNAFRVAQQRDGEIQLRLSPPELGSLKIQISVQHGALTAKLETETSAARNVILDNLPALRERLAEQDIRIEKFDVDVRRDGGQNFDNQETQQQQQRDNAARSANRLPTPRNGRQVLGSSAGAMAASSVDGRLDIRI
jgi:flagellar hook-length control protein FliK